VIILFPTIFAVAFAVEVITLQPNQNASVPKREDFRLKVLRQKYEN
jgi:hypothetical protein